MAGSPIAQLVFLALVVAGVAIIGTQSTWREFIAGLGLHYVGVIGLLALTASVASALVGAIVGMGIVLLFANDRAFIRLPDADPGLSPRGSGHRPGKRTTPRPGLSHPMVPVARQIRANLAGRPFETSVVALAVVGAIELAVTRPLFGSVGIDGACDVLLIGGVLSCLLGGETRVAGGLLFAASAGSLALHAADPTLRAGESLLLAMTQVALALVLIYLRSIGGGNDGRIGGVAASASGSDQPANEERPVDAMTNLAEER